MKICMCPATYKRLLKWARKGGLKGALNVVRSGVTKRRKASKRSTSKRSKSSRKGGRSAQQARFKRAAKKCKGKGKGFRPCMKRELKKRR